MDHKAWLWRKKSSEKTITVNDKVNLSTKGSEQETYMEEKALEMEKSVKHLNEKLASALSECNTKDDLVSKHAKVAEEAIAGWEKAEAEAASFKQELEDAFQQKLSAGKRITQLDAALKECVQQLRLVREEQPQRIHDAVIKTSREFEKLRINLEEKLAEACKKLSKVGAENNNLNKTIQVKEKLIEDLTQQKSEAESDFNALTARLDSVEKENASLKYEVRMLEKELEIRNEERDFNRKSADASHKQHLESVKKIAKLETECQRLRLLVRKRLPGPAALAKMRNEVECLGRDATEPRRKKSNLSVGGLTVKDGVLDNCHDNSNKRINFLIERLCGMEEENKVLKETLSKKNSELQSSRIMRARTASKLSQVEEQLGELTKGQTGLELVRSTPMSYEPTLSLISENGRNEDESSSAESWASALISELENFKSVKSKEPSFRTVGASDLSLMDDFVEMERLAIVSVEKPFDSSYNSLDGNSTCLVPLESESRVYPSEATGRELVPVEGRDVGFCDSNPEIESKYPFIEKSPSWIQDIWRVILQQCRVSQRSLDEVLEEVRSALMNVNHPVSSEVIDARKILSHSTTLDPSHISGFIAWKHSLTSQTADLPGSTSDINLSSSEISMHQLGLTLNNSIGKIIELIEGVNQATDCGNQQFLSENSGSSTLCKESATLTGYTVRLFQWKSSELSNVLQSFAHTCSDLLNGKADFERFAGELSSTLDWIMNHCFSLQDVSSMKYAVKKHLNWDESRSESELDLGINSPHSETEKVNTSEENKHTNSMYQVEKKIEFKLKEENRKLKKEIMNLESGKKELEERLQTSTNKNEALVTQLQVSGQSIEGLQVELAKLKELKGLIEDQIENHKLTNEELGTQLSVIRAELNEARQKFSSLQVELEEKNNCCEELETTCLELQLQLESVSNKEIPGRIMKQEENQLRKDWEISAASEKLAECQETILNLGKQLKALASPRDVALIDKVIANSASTKANHRQSLLDQMLAEDDATAEDELKSPKTKEIICTGDPQKLINPNSGLLYGLQISSSQNSNNLLKIISQASPVKSPGKFYGLNEVKHRVEAAGGSLAIVPKKRGGGVSLWKRLLTRRKRESSKKLPLAIAA